MRSDITFRIPVVDFSRYLRAESSTQKRETADEIVNAFKEVGFVYLSKHGIPDHVVKNVYSKACYISIGPVFL